MILYRQKMFISQEYYNKVKRRVQRRAFWGTVGDAAKGGAKNAGKQTVEIIKVLYNIFRIKTIRVCRIV